jgi:hypothetical protein
MADPWELPPDPDHGDASENATHIARSRAIDAWEELEQALSFLDVQFAKAIGSRPKYGSGLTFKRRLNILEIRHNEYKVKHPHQDNEAAFDFLVCHLRKYSDRRNDIVHGVVQPIPLNSGVGVEFGLLPASYTIDRKGNSFPEYIYNSEIINQFKNRFSDLWRQTTTLTYQLFPPSS